MNDPPDTPNLSHTFSQLQTFHDFVSREDETGLDHDCEPTAQVLESQYPQLHQLHQQPLLGIPSGSEFVANPHMLPLPYYHGFNHSHYIEENLDYFPQGLEDS